MKNSMAVRLGLVVLGVLISGSAWAQGPGGGGPGFGEHHPPFERALGPGGNHGRWWNNPKIAEKLKLTDDQRKAMDGILLEHREKLIDLRASVEKAELVLEPLISADQPDEGKILSQIDKVAQARAELEKANARFLLAIRSKLTPEQWKLLQAERASHEQHGDWEHGRPEGGPGNRLGNGFDSHDAHPDRRHFEHSAPPEQPAGAGPQGRVEDESEIAVPSV